ncbi:MAG: NAD(P)/FAD-dependent oxidoreductase [Candidatus Aegiribacteria sp.]|nr:NAD(P)/FAD-dependent oxidoreductase [Candidatus Aegiribacteria sp.]
MIETAIIGAGPAGCAAAVQCRRLGLDLRLLDTTGRAGGLIREARLIENYPGLSAIPGSEFAEKLCSHISGFGITVLDCQADSIVQISDGFEIFTNQGVITSASVIVATGTVPVDYSIPGNASSILLRSILDIPVPVPSTTIVIGGGEAALDYALSLSDAGSNVNILVRNSCLRACGKLKDEVETRSGIRILYNTEPVSIINSGNDLLVRYRSDGNNGEHLVGSVLAATGRKPKLPVMQDEMKYESGNVRTSIPGLYIIGDASLGSLGQAAIAAGHGLQAAGHSCDFIKMNGPA